MFFLFLLQQSRQREEELARTQQQLQAALAQIATITAASAHTTTSPSSSSSSSVASDPKTLAANTLREMEISLRTLEEQNIELKKQLLLKVFNIAHNNALRLICV